MCNANVVRYHRGLVSCVAIYARMCNVKYSTTLPTEVEPVAIYTRMCDVKGENCSVSPLWSVAIYAHMRNVKQLPLLL